MLVIICPFVFKSKQICIAGRKIKIDKKKGTLIQSFLFIWQFTCLAKNGNKQTLGPVNKKREKTSRKNREKQQWQTSENREKNEIKKQVLILECFSDQSSKLSNYNSKK